MKNKEKFSTPEEALDGWRFHCIQHPLCGNCPYYGTLAGDSIPKLTCFLRWLYDEYVDNIEKFLKDRTNDYKG